MDLSKDKKNKNQNKNQNKMKEVLRIKFSKLRVTKSSIDYEGSLTLDKRLCDAAGLEKYDIVEVNNFNGNRDRTYILISESEGKGEVAVNGALSTRHRVGDYIHVLAMEYRDGCGEPIIIKTDENNLLIKQ